MHFGNQENTSKNTRKQKMEKLEKAYSRVFEPTWGMFEVVYTDMRPTVVSYHNFTNTIAPHTVD